MVDNASTDDTAVVAERIWLECSNNKIDFTTVHEPAPGLSKARRKGIDTAKFEFLIFCDDDNWLDENYVQNTFRLLWAKPAAAILGGIGTAQFQNAASKPAWFDKLYHGYAVGPQAESMRQVAAVYGAGMVVRKSALQKAVANTSAFLSDRNKKNLSAGGDTELCFRAKLAGYEVWYCPELTFKHFLHPDRLTWDHLKKLHAGFAESHVIINLYERALNNDHSRLPVFYWLKKALYYTGIYLKYWPMHYSAYKNGEGTVEELRHITWKIIALNYFEYNFKTLSIYQNIIMHKKNSAQAA